MARTSEAVEKSKKQTYKRRHGQQLRFSDLTLEARHQLEKLKSSIILRDANQSTRSILFSSYNHGEGTSTVTANFAEALAQDEKYKILLVDANTRCPRLHKIFNPDKPKTTMAFSDLLSKQITTSNLPEPSSGCNLSITLCGDIAYHPSQVFDHARFTNFIKCVTKLFDFVIFDSSPIGRYYDSIVLASHVDGVILVVEAEETPCYELKRAKQILQDRNIPILGVVLNRRRFHIPDFIFQRFF